MGYGELSRVTEMLLIFIGVFCCIGECICQNSLNCTFINLFIYLYIIFISVKIIQSDSNAHIFFLLSYAEYQAKS